MVRRTQTYAIRLAVEGGGQVKAELVSVGQSGGGEPEAYRERGRSCLGRAEGPRPPGGAAAHRHRTLGGALAGLRRRWSRRSDRLLDLGSGCHRQDRGQDRRRRRGPAGAAVRRKGIRRRAADAGCGFPGLHPPGGGGGPRHGQGPRTHWRRWASPCTTRAAICAAVPPDAVFGAIRPLRRGSPARPGARSRGFIGCRATCCGWCRPSATSTSIGSHWRRDFTVMLRRAELNESLARSGLANERLTGHRLDVRGYPLKTGR